ncbi:MAG: hypothetical protein JWQ09_4189 [Segetibacter sp.]|nr:hypothetical protein [Segetibacter sp.]
MSLAEKNNIQNAVKDLLDLIDKANEMISLHESQLNINEIALSGYQHQRLQFLQQLNELLSNYKLHVDLNNKAA